MAIPEIKQTHCRLSSKCNFGRMQLIIECILYAVWMIVPYSAVSYALRSPVSQSHRRWLAFLSTNHSTHDRDFALSTNQPHWGVTHETVRQLKNGDWSFSPLPALLPFRSNVLPKGSKKAPHPACPTVDMTYGRTIVSSKCSRRHIT